MSNFAGYYIKVGNCYFNDPLPAKDGYKCLPHLRQTADSGVLASGALEIKVLPHSRSKIEIQFPIMTPEQFRVYYNAIMNGDGAQGMYLTMQYYNDGIDQYETGTFYHNDLSYQPAYFSGKRMIQMDEIHFIEH